MPKPLKPATAVPSCVTPEASVVYTMSPGTLPTVLTSSRDVFFGAPASPLLEGMRAARSRALSTMCSAPIMSAWPAPSCYGRARLPGFTPVASCSSSGATLTTDVGPDVIAASSAGIHHTSAPVSGCSCRASGAIGGVQMGSAATLDRAGAVL